MIENALNCDGKFTRILFSSGFLGQKIYADYTTQKKSKTNSFYLLNNCAFMISGVNMTLCGDIVNEDMEELLSFCHFFGVLTIESQILNLPLWVDKKMVVMEYRGGGRFSQQDIVENEDIYLFIQFCCENFEGIEFDNVYANFARKVNEKVAQTYYIKKDGRIASGAIATEYFDKTRYITFVSTAKKYRKQGLAQIILSHIISQSPKEKILLKCENSLCEYYSKLGFKGVDTITINSFESK